MEKNLNMQNGDENLCIKYVMNELDPSEIVMVEKAIERDEDILIEIESLRSTWKKINSIPKFEPPAQLCEAIISRAAAKKHNKRIGVYGLTNKHTHFLLATAAVLTLSVTLGLAGMYSEATETHSQGLLKETESSLISSSPTNPWVDNDNVIRINTNDNRVTGALPAHEVMHSMQRFRLIDDQTNVGTAIRDIQLTRTSN